MSEENKELTEAGAEANADAVAEETVEATATEGADEAQAVAEATEGGESEAVAAEAAPAEAAPVAEAAPAQEAAPAEEAAEAASEDKGAVLKRAGQAAAPEEAEAAEATAEAAEPSEDEAKPLRRVVDVSEPAPEAPAAPAAAADGEPAPSDEDFAAAFEASAAASNEANVRLDEGDEVEGTVAFVGDDNVFVNLGTKTEGYLSRGELTGPDGELTVAPGDTIKAYVVGVTPSGIHLSKGISGGASDGSLDAIAQAFQAKIPVEGLVKSRNKGGYDVTVLGKRAFCPISQIDVGYTNNPDEHLEQTYMFRVVKFEQRGKHTDIVVSRADLLREERAEEAKGIFSELAVGQVLEGKVRNIQKFGVFVDLGGLDGLVHISELSWHRVDHPSELVKPGERVSVKVIALDNMEAGPQKARISLSMKAVQTSPWERVGSEFVIGGAYEGTVVRLEPYGAFIQLAAGLDGLAHISELSLSRISHPRQVLEVGQSVQVKIKDIDYNRERIALSVKALLDDPWASASARYGEGLQVTGKVENIEDFGVFVGLEPGVTGLIPLSELNTTPGRPPSEDFAVGDEVQVWVLSVDPERRRLTLTRREPGSAPRQSERRGAGGGGGRGRDDRRGGGGGGGRGRRSDKRGGRGERRGSAPTVPGGNASLGTFADLFADKLGLPKK